MSGICGIVRFDGNEVKKEEIQNMLDAMKNRGNDSEGIWVEGNVGFGHKMLWTTPESLYENQPLISKDGNLVLTADARIDNRDELFEKLEINENDFEVMTDADLILWSYQKWGEDSPKFLKGDFSFAIFDKVREKVFFAKDHIGIRPFFYYYNEDGFYYASEISVLFAISSIKKQPNNNVIETFLENKSLTYEETFYKNINRLAPAHRISLDKDKISISRYWYPEKIQIDTKISFKEASDKFKDLLQESTIARLRSAYPVGCELSGGLDSSSVVCIASNFQLSTPITLFSQRYGDLECDESFYIDLVGESLNLNIESVRVDQLDYKNEYSLDSYLYAFPDWPTYGSFMGLLPLAKIAEKKNIRVLLTGQGGDHVVEGSLYMLTDYLKTLQLKKLYRELKYRKWSKKIIKSFIIWPLIPEFIINMKNIFAIKNRKNQITLFCEKEMENIKISLAFKEDLSNVSGSPNAFWCDSNVYHDMGKFNIESRHPYFDIRLVEFCLSLPPEYKLKLGVSKRVLREAMKGILPEPVRIRNDKAIFNRPVEEQLNIEYNKEEENYIEAKIGYYFDKIDRDNILLLANLYGIIKWYKRNFS